MKQIESVREIVLLLGGVAETARVTYRNSQAVSNWLSRGFIPPRAFDLVEAALAQHGCAPARSLFRFDEKPARRKRRADAA